MLPGMPGTAPRERREDVGRVTPGQWAPCRPGWHAGSVARHRGRQSTLLHRLGTLTGRHPWVVVMTWLALVVAFFALALGGVTGQGLFDRLHSGDATTPGEAQDARELLTDAGGGELASDTLMVHGSPATDPVVRKDVATPLQRIHKMDGVKSVVNPLVLNGGVKNEKGAPLVVDEGGRKYGFLTVVEYDSSLDDEELAEVRRDVDVQLTEISTASQGTDSERGSLKKVLDEVVGQVETDMKVGEGLALPISFVIMVLVFGGFLAAGIPIAGAIASIGGALASLWGFSHLIDLDATVVNIVSVLGLGLCIDYGLLVVSRFREEMRGLLDGAPLGRDSRDLVIEATGRTVDRAGRTVVFSAVTVAIALSGLLFFPSVFMRAAGAAGVSVVVLCLVVAVTLVPALCTLSARRLIAGQTERDSDTGVFASLAKNVQKAPWAVVLLVLAALVAMAVPATRMEVTSSGIELLPSDNDQRDFFEDLNEDYPDLASPDVRVVTTADGGEVRSWAKEATDLPHVTTAEVTSVGTVDGKTVRSVDLRTSDGPLGDGTRDVVDDLRTDRPPFDAKIGGPAADLKDFTQSIVDNAALAIGTVVLASFVLLFLMTGSIIVPIKALLMNIVSLGASLGVLVWVFQDGHLQWLLGFESVGAVEVSIPVLVLAFGFGLSMDYEVFLLSRIVELHERGYSTNDAVRLGLQRSGKIITSAALLMIIVFSGFVLARVLAVKETGVALVLAIFIDATLVRMLLVPATMSVLGEWNWWAPRWMKRLHARFGITE